MTREAVGKRFRDKLVGAGLDDPVLWSGLKDCRDQMTTMLLALGLANDNPENCTKELDWCLELQAAAQGAGELWTSGAAALSDAQLAIESASRAKKARTVKEESKMAKLCAAAVLSKPIEWKSKAYLRAELAGDEAARKKADDKERSKWARRVHRILLEGSKTLPFGAEI